MKKAILTTCILGTVTLPMAMGYAQMLEPLNVSQQKPAAQTLASAPAQGSRTFQTGVTYEWTPQTAREASFRDINPQLDTNRFPAKDPELEANLQARLDNETQIGDKVLSFFSNGDYCYYYINTINTYCYHSDARLYKISVANRPKQPGVAPLRELDYSYPEGKLVRVGLMVDRGESYVFSPDGKMYAHWIGNTAQDESGAVIMTREWITPEDQKN